MNVLSALALLGGAMATQQAIAVPICTIASGAVISFGTVVPLRSTGDISTNSGSSFWINCNAEVNIAPAIHSASPRVMSLGGSELPFQLSAEFGGGLELPFTSPGRPVDIIHDGSNQTVTLFAKIHAADFSGLPTGTYAQVVSVTVEY